jgi:hypothetical protein
MADKKDDRDDKNWGKNPTPGTHQSQAALGKSDKELDKEKEEDKPFREVIENEDGTKTVVTATSEAEAKQAKENLAANVPDAVNETARMNSGNPGQTNLTRDSRLTGELSFRDDRDQEEIVEELEDKTGPNPTPNRIGNEVTNAMNNAASSISTMANLTKDTIDVTGLSEDDKDDLREKVESLKKDRKENKKKKAS